MRKKVAKCLVLILFLVAVTSAIISTYKWIVCGNQYIEISTVSRAYTNSDLYVLVKAKERRSYNDYLETKTKIQLLDSKGKKVKNTEVSYDGNVAKISVPEIENGNYFIEAKVSSKAGKDTVQKEIYITSENKENVTISLDKGIYKPRRYGKF